MEMLIHNTVAGLCTMLVPRAYHSFFLSSALQSSRNSYWPLRADQWLQRSENTARLLVAVVAGGLLRCGH